MNENLIPEANLPLMKQVERAVRPVPAGRKRKLQMREELLAHLSAIYQEELPRQPSESAALSARSSKRVSDSPSRLAAAFAIAAPPTPPTPPNGAANPLRPGTLLALRGFERSGAG